MFNRDKFKLLVFEHSFDKIVYNFVSFFSVFYLLFLIFDLYIPYSAESFYLLLFFDTLVSFLFFFEFFYFFIRAKNRLLYVKENFMDLLSSFPLLLVFGSFGLLPFFNVFKFIRGFETIFRVYEYLLDKRVSLLKKIMSMFFLVVIYFSIIIVYVEKYSNDKLSTFHDGLWWAIATITSVGYGDVTPSTYLGKFIAIFLMVFGIGLSSAVGALFVTWLLKPSQDKIYRREVEIEKDEDKISSNEEKIIKMEKKILKRLDQLEGEIHEIKDNGSKR